MALKAARGAKLIPGEKEKEADVLEAKYLKILNQHSPLLALVLPELDKRVSGLAGVLPVLKGLQGLRARREEGSMRGNLGALRSAISIYYGSEGFYPLRLCTLVPKYIQEIPPGDWKYNPKTGEVSSKSHPDW